MNAGWYLQQWNTTEKGIKSIKDDNMKYTVDFGNDKGIYTTYSFDEVEIFDTDASREHYEEDNRSWEGKIASYIEYKNNILGALEAKVSDLMDGADDKRRS